MEFNTTLFTPYVLDFFTENLKDYDTNYLEIGVYYGKSIKELSETYTNKTIFAIDPFIEDGHTTHKSGIAQGNELSSQKNNVISILETHKNIKLFQASSVDFYKTLTKEIITDLNIGCIFMDGDHHYSSIVNDYKLSIDLIGSKKGIICFDDLHLDDVLQAYNEFIQIMEHRIENINILGNTCKAVRLKND